MAGRRTLASFILPTLVTVGMVGAGMVGGCGQPLLTFAKDSRARGLTYMQTNQTEEAKGAFQDAVRQNPRDYESYGYLGQLNEKDKAYATALSNYRTSLDVQNMAYESRENVAFKVQTLDGMARCLSAADQHDTDINKLEITAASSPSGDQYLVLAKTFALRGDADSAIDAYAKAVAKEPKAFYILKEQALYLEQIGHKPLAEQALRQAYRIRDDDEQINTALRRLGIVPGPSLKTEDELHKPALPRGPIPELIPSRPGEPATPARPIPGANPAD